MITDNKKVLVLVSNFTYCILTLLVVMTRELKNNFLCIFVLLLLFLFTRLNFQNAPERVLQTPRVLQRYLILML